MGRLFLSLATAAALSCHGASATAATPKSAVDALLASAAKANGPGCAVSVVQAGRTAYSGGFGLADIESRRPMDPTIPMDVGSIAKQFTAASILLLEQRGRLSLDDDIRKYLPELPAYREPVTIRQLLSHTSGYRDYIDLLVLSGALFKDAKSPQDALAALKRQKSLNFRPATAYQYSNSGFFLASLIVERITGKSLAEFARANIFEPLQMRHTAFRDGPDLPFDRFAASYAPSGPSSWSREHFAWTIVGDGGLFTTAEDLARWARNLQSPKVGGKAMIRALHTASSLEGGSAVGYGLGTTLDKYRGLATAGHNGAWEGYQAEFLTFPGQQFAASVLCNSVDSDPTGLARKIADIYLAGQLEPAVADPPAPEPTAKPRVALAPGAAAKWAGRYRNADFGNLREFLFSDSGLLVVLGEEQLRLHPVGPAEFEVEGRKGLYFRFSDRGAGGQRRVEQVNRLGIVIRFTALAPDPSAAELADLSGAYFSDELAADFNVFVDGGKLMLRRPNYPPSELLHLGAGRFATNQEMVAPMVIEFTGQDRPAGFTMDVGDIHGMRFVRSD